jgi:hypothetical protein
MVVKGKVIEDITKAHSMVMTGQIQAPVTLTKAKRAVRAFEWDAGWAPRSVRRFGEERNLLYLTGTEPRYLGYETRRLGKVSRKCQRVHYIIT